MPPPSTSKHEWIATFEPNNPSPRLAALTIRFSILAWSKEGRSARLPTQNRRACGAASVNSVQRVHRRGLGQRLVSAYNHEGDKIGCTRTSSDRDTLDRVCQRCLPVKL